MTAVEWLVEQLAKNGVLHSSDIAKAKSMEEEQKQTSIENQVNILKDTLDEMMTGFESEEDRMDFILDICNGYKTRTK